jgi:hypothetical protein
MRRKHAFLWEMIMKTRIPGMGCTALVAAVLVANASADVIAKFADPMPNGGGANMFKYINGSHGLYGGWAGPPPINLETALGSFPDCTMSCYPMFVYPTGQVVGGQVIFYTTNNVEILRMTFANGFVDNAGLRCGSQTGGSVQFTYSPGGVQLPPGLSEPLQGAWFNFEFHNRIQGPRGPEWTASFTCAAVGRKGDLNCDGVVDFADINPFVLAVSDPAGYAQQYPFCDRMNGDVNNDGVVDFTDINGFVSLLSGI